MDEPIDRYIQRRNDIQLMAETEGDGLARECWTRLGVANRHIRRVLAGVLPLTPGLVYEIDSCLQETAQWLTAALEPQRG